MADKTQAPKEKLTIDWVNVIKIAAILFAITAVASLALALTNYATASTIEQRNIEANDTARKTVLPDADAFEEVEDVEKVANKVAPDETDLILEAFKGTKGGEVDGYTVKTAPKGYGGAVEVLTGFDKDGKISGITILSQEETPGLGAKAADAAFTDQFAGKDGAKEVKVSKEGSTEGNNIAAITGATITSDAVTHGVNLAEKVYKEIAQGGGI